jgi:hypothetical protein
MRISVISAYLDCIDHAGSTLPHGVSVQADDVPAKNAGTLRHNIAEKSRYTKNVMTF